jgi:hypothetical protein
VFAAAVGVAAVGAYSILAVGYEEFYNKLGTTPDAAGISQSVALTRSAPALALSIGLAAAFVKILVILRQRYVKNDFVHSLALWIVAALLALGLVAIWWRADQDASHVRRGGAVHGIHLLWVPLVDATARPAQVTWTGSPLPEPQLLHDRLLLIGATAVHYLFFDADSHMTVAVPVNDVVVSVRP